MLHFFEFEADFVASLRCIPMQVRYKLDTCGIKLKLQHWHSFSTVQRQTLIDLPCSTAAEIENYRQTLRSQVFQNFSDYPSDILVSQQPQWLDTDKIPENVQQHIAELRLTLSLSQWQSLNPLQRFALIKLSISNHENNNFLPAMREFGLLTSQSQAE